MNNAVATQAQRPKFSVMISTPGYQKMINNTLRDPKPGAPGVRPGHHPIRRSAGREPEPFSVSPVGAILPCPVQK